MRALTTRRSTAISGGCAHSPPETQGRQYAAYFMSGNGGNKVAVFPELDLVAVITSVNYGARGMHEQVERLISEHILAAVQP